MLDDTFYRFNYILLYVIMYVGINQWLFRGIN